MEMMWNDRRSVARVTVRGTDLLVLGQLGLLRVSARGACHTQVDVGGGETDSEDVGSVE